ncbi:hypothetical protein GS72_22170 [Salmonella enterica subsp. enterica serovar Give]|nr:hypothetical protein [Salmonella enterica subsp. enterica serovar Give]
MNIKTFYMTIIMTLVQTVSFESISSGEVPNFNEKENSFKNCQPWSVRYSKLEQASSQNLVITARHRGDFNKETPENSLGAFLNSYERCRPSVETDLRLTKDGKVVLFHDLNVGKMTNPNY